MLFRVLKTPFAEILFLQSNNISAAQIRQDYQIRLQRATHQDEPTETQNEIEINDDDDDNDDNSVELQEQGRKRKRRRAAALSKIKQNKEAARRKSRRIGGNNENNDTIVKQMDNELQRIPDHIENCEICGKRFTVTAYSRTGPNGGLLCPKCSKDMANKEKKPTAKRRGPKSGRRQTQSNLLDGVAPQGASSLVEMCTKKVADNIQNIEEFGDLPRQLLHRLSQILSKRRIITSRTLNLFLRPDLDSIDIYDCAKLETDDFQKIFMLMPLLTNVNLRFAGQMKDDSLKCMISRNAQIKNLCLDAVNLVSDPCWRLLFQKVGSRLESLKLSNLDSSLDDETVEEMCRCCTALRRLKLKECWRTGDASLRAISTLTALEHLSLRFIQETDADSLLGVVSRLGPNLRTLSLEGFSDADDRLLSTIHDQCRLLCKLRLSDNTVFTDKGFVNLFKDWYNLPLRSVDLSSTRDVDYSNPDGPSDPTGLASEGFIALMKHSGSAIQSLNIASCRHISRAAFEAVFSEDRTYPNLKELDVSFHTVMDDYLANRIFRCCPLLKKLITFACFNMWDVRVPRGLALIGGLKAQDSIIVEGDS